MKLLMPNKRYPFCIVGYIFCFALVLLFLYFFTGKQKAFAVDTSISNFNATSAYNNLISDEAFIETNSMSVSDIQSFLELKGSYLAGYSENGRSAAQIIYDAALALTPDSQSVAFNAIPAINPSTGTVSPRVILVVLDKEQSLITGKFRLPGQGDFTNTDALNYALTWAMGYGCPDSGPRDSSKAGFAKQIDWGAWQLRYNWYRAQGYGFSDFQVGQTVVYSNWYGTYSVTYSNRATSSLYRYTPHVFNGNYNFWKFYNSWFSKKITIEIDPTGTGQVSGPGILCKENCNFENEQLYQYGNIELNADSGPDSDFNSIYCDGVKSQNDKCNFTLDDSHTAKAIFDQSLSRSVAYNSLSGNWDANRSRFMLSGDYNNDGKDEIASFYDYGDESSRIWVFSPTGINDLTPSSWYYSGLGNWNLNNTTYATSGDYNQDGFDDIAIFYRYFNESIRIWVFESNGTSFAPKSWFYSGPNNWSFMRNYQVTSGDYDNDGKTELATMYDYGNDTMRIWVFGNDGSKFTPRSWYLSGTGNWNAGRSKALVSGDYDNDGKTELATMYDYGNDTMRIWVFGNDGSKFTPSSWHLSDEKSWSMSRSFALVSADMDKDGYDDIITPYRYDQYMMKIWIFKSNNIAGNSFSNQMWFSTGKNSWSATRSPFITVGDFCMTNTEGDEEIALMYNYDDALTKIWLFQQTGLVHSNNN